MHYQTQQIHLHVYYITQGRTWSCHLSLSDTLLKCPVIISVVYHLDNFISDKGRFPTTTGCHDDGTIFFFSTKELGFVVMETSRVIRVEII